MLEKLYNVLYDKKLFTQDFDKFKQAWSNEEYKKKVYDVVNSKKLFTQDYDVFVNAYSEGKQQGDVATDAAAEPAEDLASTSAITSSDLSLPIPQSEGPADPEAYTTDLGLTYGDQRTSQEQIDDFMNNMYQALSATGTYEFLKEKDLEERYYYAGKLISNPTGSPKDIKLSYYNYFKDIKIKGVKDPKGILEPLFLDKDQIKEDYFKIKNLKNDLNIKDFYDQGGTEEVLIKNADDVVDELIHESDYMNKEFLPYFFKKHEEDFYNKQIEIIESIEGDFIDQDQLDKIETEMENYQLEILKQELVSDVGYRDLVSKVTSVVSDDLGIDIKEFNKTKVIPNWAEGWDFTEGLYRFTRQWKLGNAGEQMASDSKELKGVNNLIKAYQSGEYSEEELMQIAKDNLSVADFVLLYPKSSPDIKRALGRAYGISAEEREKIVAKLLTKHKNPVEYLQSKKKNLQVRFINNLQKNEEMSKVLALMDKTELFDEDGITWSDIKRMTGEQLPQMAQAILTLGGGTYMQEAGGVYTESIYKIAEEKYGVLAWGMASREEKAQMLLEIIDAGEDDPDTAIKAGIVNAGLDFASSLFIVTKSGKAIPRDAWRSLLRGEFRKAVKKSGGKDLLADALKVSMSESLTEATQEIVSMFGVGRSTGYYDFDPKRIKEGAGQGFLSSLIFFGLGKSRSSYNYLTDGIGLQYSRFKNKNHILNLIKLEKQKIKQDLKDGNITKQEAIDKVNKANAKRDVIVDNDVYNVSENNRQQAFDVTDAVVDEQVKLDTALDNLKQAKNNPSATDQDIEFREAEVNNQKERLADAKFELNKAKQKDNASKDISRASNRINQTKEGELADKQLITFRTRKEAAAFVKRYKIKVDANIEGLLNGGASGAALAPGQTIRYKGEDIVPAFVVKQTINEQIDNSTRQNDFSLRSAFAASHEVNHFILDTVDPKVLDGVVSKLKNDMRNSGDIETNAVLEIVETMMVEYVKKDPKISRDYLNQEFLAGLGDVLQTFKALKPKSPFQRMFIDFGESISKIINDNTGLNVNYNDANSVLGFLKNYNKFLGKNAPIVIKSGTDIDGEKKSRAQISLEQQKKLLVDENKILAPMMRTNASAAKKIQENVDKIKAISAQIIEEKELAENLKFAPGLSKKAKDITRKNELNWSELMDPATKESDKTALKNKIYEDNQGTIINIIRKTFNPNIESNLTAEDYAQAMQLEALKMIDSYEKTYNKKKAEGTLAPWNFYLKDNLPKRQGAILKKLIGDKSMMFMGDATASIGSAQLGYTPDYGNFSNEEYIEQQGVIVDEVLAFTPEIKAEIREAAKKVLSTFKGDSGVNLKKQLGDALEVMLKPYIQTNVLGSKVKKNYKGQTYREFMQQNWEDIYSIIGFDVINTRLTSRTKQEKAAGIPNPFIFKITKDGKQVRDSRLEDLTGKGRGKAKKRIVNQEEFIKFFFGELVNPSTQGTRKDTLAEIIAREAGLDQISWMLENDVEFLDLFKQKQDLLGTLIDNDYIESIQRQIDRFDGSRRPGSRAQLVIDSANYNGLSSSAAMNVLEDIKNNEIIDYKSQPLNRFRNDVLDMIRVGNAYAAIDLYHTPTDEDTKVDGKYKLNNEGLQLSNVKSDGDVSVRVKISSAGNLFVPKEFSWNGGFSIMRSLDIELKGYDVAMSRIPDEDGSYFAKWLVDNNILTKKQVEKDASASGIRETLVSEGYTSITYPKADGSFGYIILNNEAFDLSFDNKINNQIKSLMSDSGSRAQLVGMKGKMSEIIEQKSKGKIKANEVLSNAAARNMRRKAGLNFSNLYVPYQLEDFVGLTYAFTPEGKKGEAAQEFIKERVMNPYFEAKEQYRVFQQNLNANFNRLLSDVGITAKTLKETVDILGKPFTKDQIVRAYLFSTQGADIDPSILSPKEIQASLDYIKSDEKLLMLAAMLPTILDNKGGWVRYRGEMHETLSIDIVKFAEGKRKIFFERFKDNIDIIFDPQIKEKLRGLLGETYVKELESSLKRMYTGRNESQNASPMVNEIMTWFNGSVNTIMFFNMRSASLQLLSTINFVNWTDNNPIAAGAAFSNQKQFWSDVSMLMNTSYIKDRMGNMKFDVEADILVEMGKTSKTYNDLLAKLFKLGYAPTRLADSFAITFGGATFYRNRFNTYKKQGMSDANASAKALVDFERTAEVSQQSSDPSKIASAQIGSYGRFLFAFANTPFQYARLSKKAALDIINNRGDLKTNISKLTYYTFVQSIIFSALQNAVSLKDLIDLGDEEDDRMDETTRGALYFGVNSLIDGQLKNFGARVGISSILAKNALLLQIQRDLYREFGKDAIGGPFDLVKAARPEIGQMVLLASSVSPPMSTKTRKLFAIDRMDIYNQIREKKEFYDLTDTWYVYPQDPTWQTYATYLNVALNIPADRLLQKLENISFAMYDEFDYATRFAFLAGWSKWNLLPKDDFNIPYPEMESLNYYESRLRKKIKEKSKNTETVKDYEKRMREKRQEKSK